MTGALIRAKIAGIIVPGERLRRVLPDRVATLQASFRTKGQMTPIDLVEAAEGMRLVFGAHRLAARRADGEDDVLAILHPEGTFGSESELRMREVAENFDRFELTALEKAANVAALRDFHFAEHGRQKPGRKAKQSADEALDELSANLALNFPEVVQRTLGLSRREVFRHLKVATIGADLRDRLAALPIASNQSELLALAAQTPDRQAAIVVLLTAHSEAGSVSVAEAIATIDGVPTPSAPKPHERVSDRFSRLKPQDQNRFFDLHAEAIERWLATRNSGGGGVQ